MRAHLALLLGACSALLVACAQSTTPSGCMEAADLLADPAAFEGVTLCVQGPVRWEGGCNAALCPQPGPCNNCYGPLVIGEPLGENLILVPSEAYARPERTAGFTPQPCYDAYCDGGVPLGCNGNDVEVHCAPAVPSRIAAVYGRVREQPVIPGFFVFEVDDVELADGPREERSEVLGTLLTE